MEEGGGGGGGGRGGCLNKTRDGMDETKLKSYVIRLYRHAKRQFFYTNIVIAKNILPKKVRKLDNSNLQQNSVKGPKDPNSAENKCQKET